MCEGWVGPAPWAREGTGQALPEVGAHTLAQRATILQPGHLGWWLPVGLAVQPHLLALQDAMLLWGTQAPDPGDHCGRGYSEAPGNDRGQWEGRTQGRVQGADIPSTATAKSFRASAWVFSATQV